MRRRVFFALVFLPPSIKLLPSNVALLKTLFGMFSEDLSIDLGTANTLIVAKDRGIVLNEPTVVALRREPRSVVAVGTDAKRLLGISPQNIEVIRPMKDGQVADFEVTNTMLAHFIKMANGNRVLPSYPRVIICIPAQSTSIEKRAIRDSARSAGAREIYLIEEPLAAAVGAGLPVQEASGSMVVDIGGGTTDVAILSAGSIANSESLKCAGNAFDNDIITYVRQKHGCRIGELTAEKIKHEIGTAIELPKTKQLEMTIQGQHLESGMPKRFNLDSNDIYLALNVSVNQIVDAVRRCLEKSQPQLIVDIADRGIVLTGGGALLSGLDQRIRDATDTPVVIASDPLKCVADGCGRILQEGNAPEYQT